LTKRQGVAEKMVITLEKNEDGICKVKIIPEVGTAYYREFSKAALYEYLQSVQNYCEWNGYEFIFKDQTEAKERLYSKKENGEEENDFILVESQYDAAKDGYGKPDAVSFTIGQYVGNEQPEKVHPFEYDNMITVSTEEARLFAQAILKLCDEIDN
jgi:hypothetical protein